MDLKLKSGLVNSHNFFDLNFKTGLLGFMFYNEKNIVYEYTIDIYKYLYIIT